MFVEKVFPNFLIRGVRYSSKCERLYSRECRVSDGRVEFTVVVRYMRDGSIKYSDNYKEVLRKASSGTAS